MTDYRKIDALAKDVERARRLAHFLLKIADMAWTDWELDFLEAMGQRTEPLTTRQAEKLDELEEASTWYDKVPGEAFSVQLLVRSCHLARADLANDDDAAFVERLQAKRSTKLRRRALGRLSRCARELGVIEADTMGATTRDPLAA